MLLEVLNFVSIFIFGLSFEHDAPRIWNYLPDDGLSAKSLSIQKKAEKISVYILINNLISIHFFLSWGVLGMQCHVYNPGRGVTCKGDRLI